MIVTFRGTRFLKLAQLAVFAIHVPWKSVFDTDMEQLSNSISEHNVAGLAVWPFANFPYPKLKKQYLLTLCHRKVVSEQHSDTMFLIDIVV